MGRLWIETRGRRDRLGRKLDAAARARLGFSLGRKRNGRDMLLAIVAADTRLFAKLGNTSANPVRLYGLGYDSDNDGEFGACRGDECTEFDEDGVAYSGEIFVAATASDTGDLYREGWATGTGFWHYGVPATPGTNPYDGGAWSDSGIGMATRQLADGDWDSWAFQLSTTPPFNSYAENPIAAASPFAPGDFNRDTAVDELDYALWKIKFGSTSDPDVDGNGNGVVDAADYTIWRNYFDLGNVAAARGVGVPEPGVPEPSTLVIAVSCCVLLWRNLFLRRKGMLS